MIQYPTTQQENILALVELRSRKEATNLINSEAPRLFSSEEPVSKILHELLVVLLQAKRYKEFLSLYPDQDIQKKISRLLHTHEALTPWQDLIQLWSEYSKPEASQQQNQLFASSDEIRAELSSLEQSLGGSD